MYQVGDLVKVVFIDYEGWRLCPDTHNYFEDLVGEVGEIVGIYGNDYLIKFKVEVKDETEWYFGANEFVKFCNIENVE